MQVVVRESCISVTCRPPVDLLEVLKVPNTRVCNVLAPGRCSGCLPVRLARASLVTCFHTVSMRSAISNAAFVLASLGCAINSEVLGREIMLLSLRIWYQGSTSTSFRGCDLGLRKGSDTE